MLEVSSADRLNVRCMFLFYQGYLCKSCWLLRLQFCQTSSHSGQIFTTAHKNNYRRIKFLSTGKVPTQLKVSIKMEKNSSMHAFLFSVIFFVCLLTFFAYFLSQSTELGTNGYAFLWYHHIKDRSCKNV